jgi:hypothetical protein
MFQTRTGRAVPVIGDAFFLTVVDDSTTHDIPRSRTIFRTNANDALEAGITEAKQINGKSEIYYCVPIGHADAAHSDMRSTLEWLGRAALTLEEGGYAYSEGTEVT